MFVGHAAVAAIAGGARPRVPLLPLLLAAYGADVVEIILQGVGASPRTALLWSHSVVALVGGALLASAAAALAARAHRVAGEAALFTAVVYASHGLCDLLTGTFKPTWSGGPTYGLGLYRYPLVDFTVEIGLVVVAALLYRRRRPIPGRRLAVVVGALVLLQLGFNVGSGDNTRSLKRGLMRVTGAVFDSAAASG